MVASIVLKIKGPLPGFTQFLATESPIEIMKNAFYFILKALFFLKILNFCPDFFGHVGKQLDKRDKVKSGSHFSKKIVLFVSTKALIKIMKMLFVSLRKLFSFSRYLNFCLDLLVMWTKRTKQKKRDLSF